MEKITFLKAMLTQCKLATENISQFREQFSKLTDDDKVWFREQLAREFDYAIE